jgi:polyisoprenoid-binding protein YceI
MIRSLAAAVALMLAAVPLHATTYTFESNHTEGVIRWNHLGFSHPTAQFSRVEGTLHFDPAMPTEASVAVTIPLANLSSGVPDLDDYLHAEEFFDVAKFPVATFKSTRVEQGAAPDRLKVTGELGLRGVTRPVTLDVTLNKVGINPRNQLPAIGFEATTVLKRSEFGLGLYVPQVGDEVAIHITAQADEAKGYAQRLAKDAAEDARNTAAKSAAAAADAAKTGAH